MQFILIHNKCTGCRMWLMNIAVGINTELHWDTIGVTGGSQVNFLCILGIP